MIKKLLDKISLRELICYVACCFVAIIGLVFIILGIVATYLPVTNFLRQAQANFSWRYVGLIIFAVAIIAFMVVLLINAKKVDRVSDREARRKQRLQAMMSDAEEKHETVIIDEHGKIEEKKENIVETAEIDNKAVDSSSSNEIKDAVISDDINLGDK